jgi:DNA polymerase-3 subunit delta
MIIKTFELNKINLKENNLYLMYGENEGYKNEIIKNNFEKFFPKEIFRYDEKDILENKGNFFNSILTKSFFEDKKLIIVSRVTEKILGIVEEIIDQKIEDTTIILSAGILEKRSKIRNLFEKEKNMVCIAFYSDNNQTLGNISNNFFREKKISISQQTINLLVERCRGNRENLNNELTKIENYIRNGKTLDSEKILKLTNLSENYNISELIDQCLAKNIKKTVHILNENILSAEDCILLVRTLLQKTKRLYKLKNEIKNNNNVDEVIKNFKPPIFWKDKEIVKIQISNWNLSNIEKMIFQISEIELLIKKNSINSTNIVSDFIISQAS